MSLRIPKPLVEPPAWGFLACREALVNGWRSNRYDKKTVGKKQSINPDSAYAWLEELLQPLGHDISQWRGAATL